MKQPINHEEAINKVLGGLREAEAPEGLEQRVLRRVAELEATGPSRVWTPAWLAIPGRGRSLAYGLAVAAVIAGGIALVSVRRPAHTPLQADARPQPSATIRTTPAVSASTSRQPTHPALRLTSAPKATLRLKPLVAPEDAEEAQVLSDTLAASHPAPPMPLTEQERLLLRIAHTGDPQELVALNAELRDHARAVRDAEFQEFFPTPPEPPSEQ